MKNKFIKNTYFSLLSLYALGLGFTFNGQRDRSIKSALFLPPASRGSVGDEAMLIGSIQYLRGQGVQKIGVISYSSSDGWNEFEDADEVFRLDRSGQSIQFINFVRHYSHFYCVGADIIDGKYHDLSTLVILANLALKTGANVAVTGFSFNENPTPDAIQCISKLSNKISFHVRDSISYSRFSSRTNQNPNLVADLAFLLNPDLESRIFKEIKKWIDSQRSGNRIVIGVNISSVFAKKLNDFELENYLEKYKNALDLLLESDCSASFLLIPHDDRNPISDVSLANTFLDKLSSTEKQIYCQVPFPCRASEIKAICSELDFVLTGRMHLAIACLGQTTPVGCITYQGKFEGLFKHFNIDNVTISPEMAFQDGKLSKFLIEIVARKNVLREQISAALPDVIHLAKNNF